MGNYINYPALEFFEGSTVDFWYAAPFTWDGIVGHSPLLGNWFTGNGATATGVPDGLTATGYTSTPGGRGYLLITGIPTTPGTYSLEITMGSVTNTQTVTVLPAVTNRGLDWYPSEPNLSVDVNVALPNYTYEIDSVLTTRSNIGWTGTNAYLRVGNDLVITSGSLPPGITVSTNLGSSNSGGWYLSGTPTTADTYIVTFQYEHNDTITVPSTVKYSNVRAYGSKTIIFEVNSVNLIPEVDAIATGYTVNGADLNTIFAGRNDTAKIPDVGLSVGGVDISNLFAGLAEGYSVAAFTGYKTGSMANGFFDIKTKFAARGSLSLAPVEVITPSLTVALTPGVYTPSASGIAGGNGITTSMIYDIDYWPSLGLYVAIDFSLFFIYYSADGVNWDIAVGPRNGGSSVSTIEDQFITAGMMGAKGGTWTTSALSYYPSWVSSSGQSAISSSMGTLPLQVSLDGNIITRRRHMNDIAVTSLVGKKSGATYNFSTNSTTDGLIKSISPTGIAGKGNTYVICSSGHSLYSPVTGLSIENMGLLYSTNGGVDFNPVTPFTSGTLNGRSWASICASGNYFVTISNEGKVAYSGDGISWTEINFPGALNEYTSVTGAYNRFFFASNILGGTSSTIHHTEDFINWSSFTSSIHVVLKVKYLNGKLFILGYKAGTLGIECIDY